MIECLRHGECNLIVRGCQTLGKSLPGRRETVEGFIAGCPEGIAACILRDLNNLQDGIIGWDTFKCDAL
jgi:hypothetical protein